MPTTEDMVDEMLQYLFSSRIDDFDENDKIDDLFIIDGALRTGAVIDKLRQ